VESLKHNSWRLFATMKRKQRETGFIFSTSLKINERKERLGKLQNGFTYFYFLLNHGKEETR